MYKEKMVKLIFQGVLGIIIGTVFTLIVMSDAEISTAIIIGMFFIGLPYCWELLSRIIGGWVLVGGIPFTIIAYIFKFLISLAIGWIVYPIVLIYTIIRAILEPKV